jgi:hypothetical protein
MEALPLHSWISICYRGHEKLGIRRTATRSDTLTYADMKVIEQYGACVDQPTWTTQCVPGIDVLGLVWCPSPGE